jgi:YidC/Oxa1 family membrane protein insertase
VGQKPIQQRKTQPNAGQGKKVIKPGSPHGFAQAGSEPKNGINPPNNGDQAKKPDVAKSNDGDQENGTGVPGLIHDSTKKSGRKRR